MKLSEKIYYCRKQAGWSQEALADRVGVSRQAVSKWETGDAEPELSKLRQLASVFGVTTDWLLNEDEAVEDSKESEKEQASTVYVHASSEDWVDKLPKFIGRMFRRFGWLYGVYIALGGAGFCFIGGLAKYMSRQMFSSFGNFGMSSGGMGSMDFLAPGTQWYMDGQLVTSGTSMNSFYNNDPVEIMGTAILILGIVMIAVGTALAIWLRKKSLVDQQKN